MLTFSEFWSSYPKRLGSNPKSAAQKKYNALVKSGIEPERMINSAKAYADELRDQKKLGTEFVCQARTWLNQERYNDYAPDPGSAERTAKINADMLRRGWKWNGAKWEKIEANILSAG
jgi:hypothetical protein